MKCPVCHTKTTESVCPNCGYTLKKDINTTTHIETNKKKIDFHNLKEKYDNLSYFRQQRYIRLVIFIIILIIFLFCTMMSMFNNFHDETFNNNPYGTYNSMQAVSILEDHTIFNTADTHINELEQLYNDLSVDFKDNHIPNNYTIYYLKNGVYFEETISGTKTYNDNNYEYSTTIFGSLQGIENVTITVKGQYIGPYNKSFDYLNKSDLNSLLNYYNMNQIYDNLKTTSKMLSTHTETTKDDQNQTIYIESNTYKGNIDGYEISIIEKHIPLYNTTNYEYSIKK